MNRYPNLKLAFSRPGFLTFKLDEPTTLPRRFDLGCTFVRTAGWSLGKCSGDEAGKLASDVVDQVGDLDFRHLHVWQRDSRIPGEQGFEPGVTPLACEVADMIQSAFKARNGSHDFAVNEHAGPNDPILDIVMVEPGEWWVGTHTAVSIGQRWPGGVPLLELPERLISRAYLKLREAVLWSGMPLLPGDSCAEIGAAPGGACQALLEMGMKVIAVDPARLDQSLNDEPNLIHLQRRGKEIPRKQLRDVAWLFTDINVPPNYTLDLVEDLVAHDDVKFKGMLLTLKMSDWELAERIPEYLERVKSWGYGFVKSRQLAFNRREICLMAFKNKAVRRRPQKRTKTEAADSGAKGDQPTEVAE